MAKVINNNFYQENSVESTIPKLRKILEGKHGIDVPFQCDKFLERCLRRKDGNIKKAAKLVEAYHQVILDVKNWDAKVDPRSYENTFYKFSILCPLATRDKFGRRVFVGHPKNWNPGKISFEEMAVAIWMITLLAITNKDDQKHGHVAVWNLEGFSLQQAYALNLRKMVKFSKWTQGGVLGRVKCIHIVNHPKAIGLIYEGIKPFLSDKMRKRVKFHKNLTELQKSLDLELTALPKICGGNLEAEEYVDKKFVKDLLNSTEFFQDMLNNGFPIK